MLEVSMRIEADNHSDCCAHQINIQAPLNHGERRMKNIVATPQNDRDVVVSLAHKFAAVRT